MSWFKFNGVSSEELGLFITEPPFRPSWSEENEMISIPGRSSKIIKGSGTYNNQNLEVKAVISDVSRISEIYGSLNGEGELILSSNPEERMRAYVNPIVPKGVSLGMAEISVNFDCFPFAYAINPTTVSIGSSYTEVNNPGTLYSEPRIEITMGKESVEGILKGDVNFDGKITPVDASMVLKEYSTVSTGGESTLTDEQKQAADMNDDGQITPSDASAILALYGDTSTKNPDLPGRTIIITTNDQELKIGVPDAVVLNGWTITVDSELQMIYYTNADGLKINILQYSTLDLPLLHTGKNYMKYTGNGIQNVNVIVNERWR